MHLLVVVLIVLPLVLAAPYRALPKLDSRGNRLPLMYIPFQRVQDVKPEENNEQIMEIHEQEVRLAEPTPDTGGPGGMPSVDAIMKIVKATDFASHKHHFQRRKDPEGTPYIEHPVAVAHILTHLGKVSDPVVIISALLHDTVEDTDTTFEEIEKEFGPEVRSVVTELTDSKLLTRDERKRWQILHAAESSHRAKLVKLADKLHNLRDIERCLPVNWTEERKTQYFNWARDVVAGLRGTNGPIEAELDALFRKYCTPQSSF